MGGVRRRARRRRRDPTAGRVRLSRSVGLLDRPDPRRTRPVPGGGTEAVVAEGNATRLLRRGDDEVVARSLYELLDDQTMPLREFVQVLTTWRNQVLPLYTAPDGSYEIEPRWKEEVVYWEGDRGYIFDAGWGVEPGVLYVPFAAVWDSAVPSWLRGRRDEVVSRLAEHSRHSVDETAEGYTTDSSREVGR